MRYTLEFADSELRDVVHEGTLVRLRLAAASARDETGERGWLTGVSLEMSIASLHGDAATGYPGTCRGLPDDPQRRSTTAHSWRLNSAKALETAGLPTWREEDGHEYRASAADRYGCGSYACTHPLGPTRSAKIVVAIPQFAPTSSTVSPGRITLRATHVIFGSSR